MCFLCDAKHSAWPGRRAFLLAAAGAAATAATTPLRAQVDVGPASQLRNLVPADEIESAATQEYSKLLAEARAKGALAPQGHPQLQRLRAIAAKLVPQTAQWNDRAKQWRWEVNLLGSKQINAFCMPGGKIAFYTGILDQLKLTDDEAAMVMGHEMAHALREHARARIAKSQGTGTLLSLGAQLLGLGQVGDLAASIGTQLLTLRFSREDETDADLVGLELAARGGYNPQAAVSLWEKMGQAGGGAGGPSFLSTHPSGPERIQQLQANVPKVQGLYQRARG
ncbi:M48 family metallopeptidase [Polaromonas sp. CT11-55]|uniref:M48 family metallopeptidase n=1 Tax=Polaromonas sp. CT11-55 TaxID=3243045 RepID=UPI0039A6B3A3